MLKPLQGESRPLEDWVTTFHLVLVALDPYRAESSWIIDSAARIMSTFSGADCRIGWLVAGPEEHAEEFLGPFAEKFLTFTDPDRELITSLELTHLPAFLHLNQRLDVVGSAEGWNPQEWREVTATLAKMMSWSKPAIPTPSDPPPFAGYRAAG